MLVVALNTDALIKLTVRVAIVDGIAVTPNGIGTQPHVVMTASANTGGLRGTAEVPIFCVQVRQSRWALSGEAIRTLQAWS